MGESDPPSEYYINLNVGNMANPEFNEICTNGKQFAFIGSGNPNPIYVVPYDKPFKLPNVYPYIQDAHISLTSYLTFSPHYPNLLLSSGEDGKIRIWDVPPVLTENIKESKLKLSLNRRVGVANFSEATEHLIAAASGVPELVLFDLNREINFRNFNQNVAGVTIQDIECSSQSDQLYSILSDGKSSFSIQELRMAKLLKLYHILEVI
jgi:WD40 repeat protein